jgi:clan AA aspartic protease (TIGR02281 family)
MMRLLNSTILLLAGIVIGWWLNGLQAPAPPVELPDRPLNSVSPAPAPSAAVPHLAPSRSAALTGVNSEQEIMVSTRHFRQLLEQQDFEEALAYYEGALRLEDDYQALLKPVLESYLQACLAQCNEGVFIRLANVWLTSYYEDIPVLLLLAEYQRQRGLPEEAATVLQVAMTYSYLPGQRERVTAALRELVRSTDDYLSEQGRLIELVGFYELLATIDIGQPEFSLRQAALYRALGEPERARVLLLALRSSDTELDPQWTQVLERELAGVSMEPEPEPDAAAAPALPLTRRGDHYLIEVLLNNRDPVVLMIDTGASMTSLSRASFERLNGRNFERMGSHLFKTANGLAQGEVYRARSLALGANRIEGVDLAILEFDASDDADGLLGMNVLRNFRFEIDQDTSLLYLRAR